MYMVRADVEGVQVPRPDVTRLTDCSLDCASRFCSEDEWPLLKLRVIVVFPSVIRGQLRITIAVVKSVDGATRVAM